VTERGSAAPLLLAQIAVVVVLTIGLADVGILLAARQRASVAADAAALAAAPVTFLPFGATAGPRREAARFAAANGAELVGCVCPVDPSWEPRTVVVVVRRVARLVGLPDLVVTVEARARFDPAALVVGS